MELGKKIRELREKKKLTQEDLGLAVGAKKPRQWGSQMERGIIKNLKQEHAIRLGSLLGVDPVYFYSDEIPKVNDDALIPPDKFGRDPLKHSKTKKETILLLSEENRALLRENAYLKSIILQHKIDIYNADPEDDTL